MVSASVANCLSILSSLSPSFFVEEGTPIGEVWKHHNLRTAYVAQHSFYHIEQHLEQSPVDYIKWRFANSVDKEDFTRSHLKLSEDEEEVAVEKKPGDVDEVIGRRKNGRTMEYECTFIGQSAKDDNKYIPLEEMVEMGLSKLVAQCDNRIAAMVAGLDIRPLITREIQTHLDDFNLDAEFGTHGKIRQLSGGQKVGLSLSSSPPSLWPHLTAPHRTAPQVKLVLAAAMWNKPHILFLDEPTNYLDREALAALTDAIKSFTGGVVIISHNSEFVQTLCTEYWEVKDGRCHVVGDGSDEDAEDGKEMKAKKGSSRKIRSKIAGEGDVEPSSWTGPSTAGSVDSVGNLNSTKTAMKEILKNPKTLEPLSKTEIRKLTKCALAAGVPLKEYVSKITKTSPEWKWLSSSIK
jgi:elongation factor 3